MKVSIIGVFPPPLGGVSIHVKRLSEKLETDQLLSLVYDMWRNEDSFSEYPSYVSHLNKKKGRILKYDTFSSIYWLIIKLKKDKADIIHFHDVPLYTSLTFILIRFLFKKKLVFTIHDKVQLTRIHKVPFLVRIWLYLLLRIRASLKWIVVSEEIMNQLVALKVRKEDINIIPAYLPDTTRGALDSRISCFLKNKIIKMCFYSQRFEDDDIYGCWETIKMVLKLKDKIDNWGLIMCIPSIRDATQMELLKNFIIDNNLQEEVIIYEDFLTSLTLLFKQCDIYLRPTTTDGDAIAIREALQSKCIPIASDIVTRPEGCITFKTKNNQDFLSKTLYVNENLNELKCTNKVKTDNYYEKILNIYKEIYK